MSENVLLAEYESVARLITRDSDISDKEAVFATFDHLFSEKNKNEMSVLRVKHDDFEKDYSTTIKQLKSECLGYISAKVKEIHKEIKIREQSFTFSVVDTRKKKKKSHADIRWKNKPMEEISPTIKSAICHQLRKRFSPLSPHNPTLILQTHS